MVNHPTQSTGGEITDEPTEMEKKMAHRLGVSVSDVQAARRRAKGQQLRSLGVEEAVIQAIVNKLPAPQIVEGFAKEAGNAEDNDDRMSVAEAAEDRRRRGKVFFA